MLNRNFLLLLQGKLVSSLGTSFYFVVVVLWLQQNTDSATLIGLLMTLHALATVLCGPFGGVLADRYSRKWIIVVCDLVAGLTTLPVFLAMLYRPDDHDLIVTLLAIDFIASGVAMTLFGPAVMALLPQMLPASKLQGANGLMQGATQLVQMIGQAIAGLLYRLLGGPLLVLATSVSFVLSALSEMFIREPASPARNDAAPKPPPDMRRDIVEGYRVLAELPGLKPVLGLFVATSFFSSPLVVAMPFYVESHLQAGPEWFGYLMAAMAGGTVIGGLLASVLPIHRGNRARVFMQLSLCIPLALLGLGLSDDRVVALGALALMSLASSLLGILMFSTLQIRIPDHKLGRATSLIMTLIMASMPVSMTATGFLVDWLEQQVALLFVGSGLAVGALTLWMAWSRGHVQLLDFDVPEHG